MCGNPFKKPKYTPPPAPEAPPAAPSSVDQDVLDARSDQRKRQRAAAGRQSTILTGSQGVLTQAQGQQKTLLG